MGKSKGNPISPDLDDESKLDWARFECAVDAAIQSGPKHRPSKHKPKLAYSFLFDGKNVTALKDALKRLRDRGFNGRLVNCSLDITKPVQSCPARLATDDGIIGWAAQIDGYGRTTLAALDSDLRVVVTHR